MKASEFFSRLCNCSSCFITASITLTNTSYKPRLTNLNLLTLEYRRGMKDKTKSELSDYVKLRPITKYDLRACEVNTFSEFKCRTDYFYYYLVRVTNPLTKLRYLHTS